MSPGTRPDSSGDAARRRRVQALAGVTVHGSDGKTVGRVRDVYLQDATGELAAITVTPRQLSARSVLIPASAIAALPEVPEDPDGPQAEARSSEAHAPDEPSAATGAASDPSAAAGAASAPRSPVSSTADEETSEQARDHVLRLHVDAATAKAGLRPPLTLHTTPHGLREAAAALHLEEGSARV